MEVSEYPVLSGDDEPVLDRLSAGLGKETGRVLGYLLRRASMSEFEDPATRLELRIGTGLSRDAMAGALDRLEACDVVDSTSVRRHAEGRPAEAWFATCSPPRLYDRVYERHGEWLLSRGRDVAADLTPAISVASARSADPSPEPAAMRIGLNWHPSPVHAPLFAAAERSDRVSLTSYQGSNRSLASLDHGESDVALVGAATTVRAQAAGTPVVPVAVLYQRTMAGLYTTRERFGEPLASADQLRGREVTLPSQSEVGLLVRLFLSQAGVLDDVTLVEATGEERAELESGRAEVVTGIVSDWMELEAADHEIDAIHVADRFPMYGPVLVTTPETIRTRADAVASFLGHVTAGWADAATDSERVLRQSPLADSERGARTFEHVLDAFGRDAVVREHGWGEQRIEGWRRLRTALERVDLLGDDT